MATSDLNTTAAVEGYLDQLNGVRGESAAEPVIRALLARSVERLHHLCSMMLGRSYPRLMRPPLNLDADEMLSAIVGRLLKALREARPQNVRQFYALAGQHMRWELNDLARRLDKHAPPIQLRESLSPECMQSETSQLSPNARRMLDAIDELPDDEREVFSLVRIQGMSHTEAAEVVGVAVKTVQRRLNRALALLAQKLVDLQPPPGQQPDQTDSGPA